MSVNAGGDVGEQGSTEPLPLAGIEMAQNKTRRSRFQERRSAAADPPKTIHRIFISGQKPAPPLMQG